MNPSDHEFTTDDDDLEPLSQTFSFELDRSAFASDDDMFRSLYEDPSAILRARR